MKLEKIEERQALWPEYWDYIMEQKCYGEPPVSFWSNVFKPTLMNTIIKFDQWLFNNRHYDLVDFRDFEPWKPLGKSLIISRADLPELNPEDLMKRFKETGTMFYSVKPTRLKRFFEPPFGDTIDEWGYKIENKYDGLHIPRR